jgi:hypothetical protein
MRRVPTKPAMTVACALAGSLLTAISATSETKRAEPSPADRTKPGAAAADRAAPTTPETTTPETKPAAAQCSPDAGMTGATRIILRPGTTALTIEQIKGVFGDTVSANPLGDGSFVIEAPGVLSAERREALERCFGEGARIFVDTTARPMAPAAAPAAPATPDAPAAPTAPTAR